MNQVVLYGTRFCGYCIAARRLLDEKGVDYQDIPLDADPKLRAEVMHKSNRHTVPQIWIGDTHVGGYTDLKRLELNQQLDSLLGYNCAKTTHDAGQRLQSKNV